MENFRIQRRVLGRALDEVSGEAVQSQVHHDGIGNTDAVILSAEELITSYAGPVVLFDGAGEILSKNGLAEPVTVALENIDDGAELRAMLADVLRNGGVQSKRFQLPIPTGQGVFDITLMPEGDFADSAMEQQSGHQRVLLLARDSTFDVNFSRALVASRQLFKDLVSCSTDFVW